MGSYYPEQSPHPYDGACLTRSQAGRMAAGNPSGSSTNPLFCELYLPGLNPHKSYETPVRSPSHLLKRYASPFVLLPSPFILKPSNRQPATGKPLGSEAIGQCL